MKAKLLAIMVFSLLIVGVLPLMSQPVEAADPAPTAPSYFIRLTDRDLLDIHLKDTLEFQLYDHDTASFTAFNFSLFDSSWKEEAIEVLESSIITPHPDWIVCYPVNEKLDIGDCTIRDDGWNITYPYISEAYNHVVATVIELLIHYFDPWEAPAAQLFFLGPDNIIVTTDGICQTIWADPFHHEPVVIQGIANFFRDYLVSLAIRAKTVYMTPDTEAELMTRGLILYRTTFEILYAQPINDSNVQYALDTAESLNATLENITLAGDVYNFEFWVDENDNLELKILLLRDGLFDWAYGFHLKSYLGWFFVGQISGQVYDPELGKPIPGATITIDKINDGLELTAASDLNGRFTVRLPRGEYEITVSAPDYEPMTSSTVWVLQWDNTDVNLPLVLEPDARSVSTAQQVADNNLLIGVAAGAFAFVAMLVFVKRRSTT